MAGLFGFDPTPGFGALNVARTQVANLTGQKVNGLNTDFDHQISDSVRSNGKTYWIGNKQYNAAGDVIATRSDAKDDSRAISGAVLGASTAGGGSQSSYNPADIAAIERQIGRTNDSLGRIGGQRNTALANLLAGYTRENARLQNDLTDNTTDYNNNRKRTTSDFASTKERIGENVRQNVSSLQRLLGSRGAGSSSAAQIMAPYAAARAGTSEQEEAGQQFSDNLNSLDTNFKRYKREFDNSINDLNANKVNQERETRSGFASHEAQLRDSLADLQNQLSVARGGGQVDTTALDNRINQLLDQIDAYAKRDYGKVLSAKDPRYAAPELQDYQVDTRGVQDQGTTQDPTYDETQAFYPVRKDEEDKFLQSLYQA